MRNLSIVPSSFVLTLLFFSIGAIGTVQAQTVLRFNGATTLDRLLKPRLSEIEAKHNVKIQLVPNGAGRGLDDLIAGRADVAMLGAPLTGVAATLNEKTPGLVNLESLQDVVVGEEDIVLIVHPSNPVKSITLEQARDLFAGKITNWKQVGGSDVAVTVVLPQVSEGVRVSVKERLLQGGSFAADARTLQTSPDMNRVVAQLPGAISCLSAPNVGQGVRPLQTESKLSMPLVLVTPRTANAQLTAVVQSIREMGL
jgi:phosphate transport system substrate-binding protein